MRCVRVPKDIANVPRDIGTAISDLTNRRRLKSALCEIFPLTQIDKNINTIKDVAL